jgi:penicillin-insensitive murein DD-endopeptidase
MIQSWAPKSSLAPKRHPHRWQLHSIGFYAKGCLAGAQALPINSETWQIMRLSRNRNWANCLVGH